MKSVSAALLTDFYQLTIASGSRELSSLPADARELSDGRTSYQVRISDGLRRLAGQLDARTS